MEDMKNRMTWAASDSIALKTGDFFEWMKPAHVEDTSRNLPLNKFLNPTQLQMINFRKETYGFEGLSTFNDTHTLHMEPL